MMTTRGRSRTKSNHGFSATGSSLLILAVAGAGLTHLQIGRALSAAGLSSSSDQLRAEVADACTVILADLGNGLESPCDPTSGSFQIDHSGAGTDRVRFRARVGDGCEQVTYEIARGMLLRTAQKPTPAGWTAEVPVAVLRDAETFRVRLLDQDPRPFGETAPGRRHIELALAAREGGAHVAATTGAVLSPAIPKG